MNWHWLGWVGFLVFFALHMANRPRIKEDPRPRCFGDYPHRHGQEAAERDCRHCPFAHMCSEDTPYFGV